MTLSNARRHIETEDDSAQEPSPEQNLPERRKRPRITEDEKAWRAQLLWTILVAAGVMVVGLQRLTQSGPDTLRIRAGQDRNIGRFISSNPPDSRATSLGVSEDTDLSALK